MECAYTLVSLSVAYFFRITVTLTSRLSSRRIMSGAYLILFDVGIPNSLCGYTLVPPRVVYYFQVTVTLTSGLNSRKIMSGAYLLYYLWYESQIQ